MPDECIECGDEVQLGLDAGACDYCGHPVCDDCTWEHECEEEDE